MLLATPSITVVLDLGTVTGAATHTLLPILAELALRGTLVLVGASAGVALLRRGPASARHAVWAAGILVLCALPVLTRGLPSVAIPVPAGWAIDKATVHAAAATSHLSDNRARVDSRESKVERRVESRESINGNRRSASALAADWLVPIWLLGTLLIATRLLIGTLAVRRRAAGAHPGLGPEWSALLHDIALELGVRRAVALRIARYRVMPLTWGIFHPVVLLPEEAEEWSRGRRRAVMLHEMAHVARFDAGTQVIGQLVLAVNWFNPLVWYAVARLRIERERACDDAVLMHGTRATDYAHELLQLARALRPADRGLAVAMAREVDLEGRLVAVLDPSRRRSALSVPACVFSLAIAAPLIALVAAGQPVASKAPLVAASLVHRSAPLLPPLARLLPMRVRVTTPPAVLRRPGIATRPITLLAAIDTPPRVGTPQDTSVAVRLPRSSEEEGLRAVGFTRRRSAGTGRFLTAEEFVPAQAERLEDLFTQMPGILVDYSTGSPVLTSSSNSMGGCVRYVIDGGTRHMADPGDLDLLVRPGQVAAIEVYRAVEVPPEFQTGEPSSCELVVIWTKAKISGASSTGLAVRPSEMDASALTGSGGPQRATSEETRDPYALLTRFKEMVNLLSYAPAFASPAPAAAAAANPTRIPCSAAPTFLRQGAAAHEPRITVDYQDAEIRNVVAGFANFSGRTIILDKDVDGTVTVEIRDQPWDLALQSILVLHQLVASEDQYGIITIDSCTVGDVGRAEHRG